MTNYHVLVEGSDKSFSHAFDGEPQINLTFENEGVVYRVTTRAHDEESDTPTIHAKIM
ncbi:hypothetical protein EV283_3766 [Sphingomonas sp. BK036]|uniref:hypothetical protein n=1 Tax=Sphingomonas sp. BK036 TaxID=2512122 RepID=UPI0010DF750F|nr:hypothetical protein [Sphingomonas sp. BK036]RZT44862.1 hypothetical protein EV283_3766 [Sphingomonas sp. BK036]